MLRLGIIATFWLGALFAEQAGRAIERSLETAVALRQALLDSPEAAVSAHCTASETGVCRTRLLWRIDGAWHPVCATRALSARRAARYWRIRQDCQLGPFVMSTYGVSWQMTILR